MLNSSSEIFQEQSCTSRGGQCVFQRDCDADVVSTFGSLCLNQRSSGVICCPKNIPERCFYGIGECNADCPENARKNAYNYECPSGEYCCIWTWRCFKF